MRFPVIDDARPYGEQVRSLPWSVVEPYRARCMKIHDQTLEELARRGGLSPFELWIHVHDLDWMCAKAPPLNELRAWLLTLGGEKAAGR